LHAIIATMIKQSDLKEIRQGLGYTQSAIAKLLHCSPRMYQYYESGEREFPIHLAELLQYKIRELKG
jgi:transcriptional regulator with XRE-family HTH domain